MGCTCAVDLAVMHPDMFSAFEDIAGDLSPNSGNKAQTIDRLFNGNAAAYASFDPSTVITRHGAYSGVTGWFDTNSVNSTDQTAAANSLCGLGSANGIRCAVVTQPGKHDWPSRLARVRIGAAVDGKPDRHTWRARGPVSSTRWPTATSTSRASCPGSGGWWAARESSTNGWNRGPVRGPGRRRSTPRTAGGRSGPPGVRGGPGAVGGGRGRPGPADGAAYPRPRRGGAPAAR